MLHEKLATYAKLRAAAGAFPPGIAPAISSTDYRSGKADSTSESRDWDHRLSRESRARCDSTLKGSASLSQSPATINLGTARPAAGRFPWESIAIRGLDIGACYGSEKLDDAITSMSCAKGESAYDLGVAMNYGYAAGSPQLLRFITEHVELIHEPIYDDWTTCLTCGTTSAIEIVFRMLCNPDDWILTESKTYSGAIEAAKCLGMNILGVQMDHIGLLPKDLDEKLRNWDVANAPKPSVLYTIPSGQNPTGTTQTVERRKAIYEIAEQHDLIVIEDDPYYFLQLGCRTSSRVLPTPDEYLQGLPPSYLSLDQSGRVLRLDSTSKILAPGLRCGWITGCSQLIAKFINHTEFSTVSPSGPSQLMLYKLLDETWGHEGFITWLSYLSLQYRPCRDIIVEACRRYLPSEISKWDFPTVGMFHWIWLDWSKHPGVCLGDSSAEHLNTPSAVEDRIYAQAKAKGVQVSKGSWFQVDKGSPDDLCFRVTFAAAFEDSLDSAIRIFADAVRDEFKLADKAS